MAITPYLLYRDAAGHRLAKAFALGHVTRNLNVGGGVR
jgi:hypothetical protein